MTGQEIVEIRMRITLGEGAADALGAKTLVSEAEPIGGRFATCG